MPRFAAVLILLTILVSGGCGRDDHARTPRADTYAAWRPLLAAEMAGAGVDRPDDLYKVLHQAVMGPAHAVPDVAHARRWIAREWAEARGLPVAGRPPLLAPLRPDGRLVRIDLVRLRLLVAAAGPDAETAAMDTLAAVFARTARRWERRPEALGRIWGQAVADTALWRGRIAGIDLAHLDREVRPDWPAVHHSDSYRVRRAPHYRVVDPALLPAAWCRQEASR